MIYLNSCNNHHFLRFYLLEYWSICYLNFFRFAYFSSHARGPNLEIRFGLPKCQGQPYISVRFWKLSLRLVPMMSGDSIILYKKKRGDIYKLKVLMFSFSLGVEYISIEKQRIHRIDNLTICITPLHSIPNVNSSMI